MVSWPKVFVLREESEMGEGVDTDMATVKGSRSMPKSTKFARAACF